MRSTMQRREDSVNWYRAISRLGHLPERQMAASYLGITDFVGNRQRPFGDQYETV